MKEKRSNSLFIYTHIFVKLGDHCHSLEFLYANFGQYLLKQSTSIYFFSLILVLILMFHGFQFLDLWAKARVRIQGGASK